MTRVMMHSSLYFKTSKSSTQKKETTIVIFRTIIVFLRRGEQPAYSTEPTGRRYHKRCGNIHTYESSAIIIIII